MSEVVRVLNWTPGCFVEMPPYSLNPTYITETLMIGYMSRELLKGVDSKKNKARQKDKVQISATLPTRHVSISLVGLSISFSEPLPLGYSHGPGIVISSSV